MTLPAAVILALCLAVTRAAAAADAPGQGPPFLDKVYEPNHHADTAFYLAAEMGVRAHHWKFGDMPKIPGVTRDDLTQIIAYIRWLQKQAGIF